MTVKQVCKKLGSQAALVKIIKRNKQTVNFWYHQNSIIDAELCLAIELATDGKLPRERLRPDLWP